MLIADIAFWNECAILAGTGRWENMHSWLASAAGASTFFWVASAAGASTSFRVASAAGRTCIRGWHRLSGRVRHPGWHRPLGDEHALVAGIRHWGGCVIINLQIEVEGKTCSPSVIRMSFRFKSRIWLRENAAVRGDCDVCDHGGECVRAITPRLRIRRTHSPALAVEIGVAGSTYT